MSFAAIGAGAFYYVANSSAERLNKAIAELGRAQSATAAESISQEVRDRVLQAAYLVILRNARARRLRIEAMWIMPVVIIALIGLALTAQGVPAPLVLALEIAGLVAGAFSMATGEYISVTSQNELTAAEVELERMQHHRDPAGKQDRLAEIMATRGWLRAKANSIEGGTSEINLNVVSKRVLGLPDPK